MDGMPIQYLDGVDDSPISLQDIIRKRSEIAANPAKYTNPEAMLKMFDYAIKYWDTPNRAKALEILAVEEERLIKEGSLVEGVGGLDGRTFLHCRRGMPVEGNDGDANDYIYGLGEEILNLVQGLEGGLDGTDDDDEKVYRHLVKTRDIIRSRPELVASVQNPDAMLRMFNYAIEHFHTPNRDKVLGILAEEEERLIASGSILNGIESMDLEGLEGLDGFWKSVKKAVSKTAKGVVNVAKKAGNLLLVLNPVTIAARNGLLVAMKMNMNHMASKLAPAYLTTEQAKAEGISLENHKKAQDALKKVHNLFQKKLRGNSKALKNAILSGKRKKWRKPITLDPKTIESETKASSDSGTAGLGIAVASVAAAAPFILKVTGFVKNLFNNEEKKQFMAEAAKAGKSAKDAKKEWSELKKKKGKTSGDGMQKVTDIITKASEFTSSSGQPESTTSEPEKAQSIEHNPNSSKNMENPNPSFLAQHGKKLLIGGAIVAVGIIAYSALKKKKVAVPASQPAALSGVPRRRPARKKAATPKKSVRSARKARPARAAKKLKSLKLR